MLTLDVWAGLGAARGLTVRTLLPGASSWPGRKGEALVRFCITNCNEQKLRSRSPVCAQASLSQTWMRLSPRSAFLFFLELNDNCGYWFPRGFANARLQESLDRCRTRYHGYVSWYALSSIPLCKRERKQGLCVKASSSTGTVYEDAGQEVTAYLKPRYQHQKNKALVSHHAAVTTRLTAQHDILDHISMQNPTRQPWTHIRPPSCVHLSDISCSTPLAHPSCCCEV